MKYYLLILIFVAYSTAFAMHFSYRNSTYSVGSSHPGKGCPRSDMECSDVCVKKTKGDGSGYGDTLKCFRKVNYKENSIAIGKLKALLRNKQFREDEQGVFEKDLKNSPSIRGFSNTVAKKYTKIICRDLSDDIKNIQREYDELSCGYNIKNNLQHDLSRKKIDQQ